MISIYIAGNSWVHRLAAGSKLGLFLILSLALFSVNSLLILLLLTALTLMLYLQLGKQALASLRLILHLMPFLAVLLLLHTWNDSFLWGMVITVRLLLLTLLANLISLTTRLKDMLNVLEWALKPLDILGINTRQTAFAVALMLRFIPVLLAIYDALMEAWQARTMRKPRWRLIPPFIIQTLKTADHVGLALQARGGARGLGFIPNQSGDHLEN